jgi:hypothetical protein
MARALSQIISELDAVYRPQKDLYNKQLGTIDPQLQAEQQGLEAVKKDTFGEITSGANRRGLLFSGIPLEEQARYTGQQFLPAVANLKAKYAQQRFNLQDALSKIGQSQYSDAYSMYRDELAMDEARAARAAASGGSGGFGFGGGSIGGGVVAKTAPAQAPAPKTYIGNDDFRGHLAYLANQGNSDARVALKYSGNTARYDGPVSNVEEYQALRRAGIGGNYYIPGLSPAGGGDSGVPGLSSRSNLSNVRFN